MPMVMSYYHKEGCQMKCDICRKEGKVTGCKRCLSWVCEKCMVDGVCKGCKELKNEAGKLILAN